MDTSSDLQRIERVVLACVQCRSRHVKCDATQPVCNRCRRDGKECVYQKSRRGGLDKAALARRRIRLQQEAEGAQRDNTTSQEGEGSRHHSTASTNDQTPSDNSSSPATDTVAFAQSQPAQHNHVAFHVNNERLLELFFENFWPSFPIVLPLIYLQARRPNANHGMDELLPVLRWIGSLYAPWTPSEPFYITALEAISSPALAHTPFNVQALMLFALAQYHSDMKVEARTKLDTAITMALELGMNQRHFARMYGGGDPVLEESWRRTYYILHVVDQNFAIVSNTPFYTLLTVPNTVNLPCDDEYYESGLIPPVTTWNDFQDRGLADIEVIYSSIVYLYDMAMIIAHVMTTFLEIGTIEETSLSVGGTKLAVWSALLPACKKDSLRQNGQVDEVMFMAHMIHTMVISTLHRPFSSLEYVPGELQTQSFFPPSPFILPSNSGRNAHTARALKATEIHTRLLAIPFALEKHNVFTMCITAQLAAVQVSACTHLLGGHALSIARDRVRLSIGFLSTMGSTWPLGKKIAKEVRAIAGSSLSTQHTVAVDAGAELDILRDELVWPVDPSAQIDVYSGIVLPFDWNTAAFSYSSSTSSGMV